MVSHFAPPPPPHLLLLPLASPLHHLLDAVIELRNAIPDHAQSNGWQPVPFWAPPRSQNTHSPCLRPRPPSSALIPTASAPALQVLMLNMANPNEPGGGWNSGVAAQEEDLFRRSDYALGLTPLGNAGQMAQYPIPVFGGIVTENVTIFRDDEQEGYAFLPDPFTLNMIAIAAFNCHNYIPPGQTARAPATAKMPSGDLVLTDEVVGCKDTGPQGRGQRGGAQGCPAGMGSPLVSTRQRRAAAEPPAAGG